MQLQVLNYQVEKCIGRLVRHCQETQLEITHGKVYIRKVMNVATKLENEAQYNWAVERIDSLLKEVDDNTPDSDPRSIELNLLSSLVEEYEDVYYPIESPSLVDVIKLRMYEMGLNQVALSKLLGINTSRICEYLSGKKQPTLAQARVISQKLNIDPAIVLGV